MLQAEREHTMTAATGTRPRKAKKPKRELGSGRVLIADDDTEMRGLLASELRSQDFDVVEATDGLDLLDKFAECVRQGNPVDLIITDHRMPRLTGLQVLKQMSEKRLRTPVILITAFGDYTTHVDAWLLGVATVMDKPFQLETLLEAAHKFRAPR